MGAGSTLCEGDFQEGTKIKLSDNIFYGQGFRPMLEKAVKEAEENQKAKVFGYYVNDSECYGVAEFDKKTMC